MTEKTIVEWWRHPLIEEIDNYVESRFDKQGIDDYHSQFNAIHMTDWKPEITLWIQERLNLFETLQEMVDALPDNEKEEYELE